MQLSRIELKNFRSYSLKTFEFPSQGLLIIGKNGSGKTNLLEAIAYCGLGKSIRFHCDDELVRLGEEYFRIEASVLQDTGLSLMVTFYYDGQKKLLSLDDIPARNLSRILETIKVIYCAPEDVNIISGAPRLRRQFFDLAISQIYPDYLHILRKYLHIVSQRNSLFKGEFSLHLKKVWDARFVDAVLELMEYRKKYLGLVNSRLSDTYADISDSISSFTLLYRSSLKPDKGCEFTAEDLNKQIREIETREKQAERSLIGAHLDDYCLEMNHQDIRSFGSGGQKRILILVLRLIQAELISKISGIKPILLFDDVFAELDDDHSRRIKQLIDGRYQVFISSPKHEIQELWTDMESIQLQGSIS